MCESRVPWESSGKLRGGIRMHGHLLVRGDQQRGRQGSSEKCPSSSLGHRPPHLRNIRIPLGLVKTQVSGPYPQSL